MFACKLQAVARQNHITSTAAAESVQQQQIIHKPEPVSLPKLARPDSASSDIIETALRDHQHLMSGAFSPLGLLVTASLCVPHRKIVVMCHVQMHWLQACLLCICKQPAK